MALSLGTLTLSTRDAVTAAAAPGAVAAAVLSAEADPAPAAGWSVAAKQGTLCPLHPGLGPGAG